MLSTPMTWSDDSEVNMGIIFNDSNDAQVESLMKNTHLGTTWAMRYLRIKYVLV